MAARYMFGFHDQPMEISNERFEITGAQAFDRSVEKVRTAKSAGERWFHPPLAYSTTEKIEVPAALYRLPSTHVLVTWERSLDQAFGEFLVLVLGFLKGQRFTIEGIGHLRPTPWKSGELVSFIPADAEILACLDRAAEFWDAHDEETRKLMFGAIHWFLVAQSYDHQYERFAWAYTVLDNLHAIALKTTPDYAASSSGQRGGHGHRPLALSDVFGSPLPEAFSDPGREKPNAASLVNARNELVHEARWAGEPLGYAVSDEADGLISELEFFCSQNILALLGVPCRFRGVSYSRSRQCLDVLETRDDGEIPAEG